MLPPSQEAQIKREPDDHNNFTVQNAPNHKPTSSATNSLPASTSHTPQPQTPGANIRPNMIARPNVSGAVAPIAPTSSNVPIERQQQRQDWTASQRSQHELWDPFLFTGDVNNKIKTISQRTNLVEPQSGVLVNTQKHQPPPTVRVNGYEGASRIIKDGQSIIDTRSKADRLQGLINILSLAAKTRLMGLLSSAGRIAEERRKHSQGRIPEEWADVAITQDSAENGMLSTPPPPAGTKRKQDRQYQSRHMLTKTVGTYAQANDESGSANRVANHSAVTALEKYSKRELKAESARQAKRRKRSEAETAKEKAETAAQEEAEVTAIAEVEKKGTKKSAKAAARDSTDANSLRNTNDALASALSGRSNNPAKMFGVGKKKSYAWMTGGSAPASGAATPVKPPPASKSNKEKGAEAPKGLSLGDYDESTDPGVQLRDLLSVLEFDGRAVKSFVRGSSSNPFDNESNG